MRSHLNHNDGPVALRLTLFERLDAEGVVLRTELQVRDGSLVLHEPGEPERVLPEGVIEAVFARYGKVSAQQPEGMTLILPDGARLVRFDYLPRYEVLPKTYLALIPPAGEPVVELATAIAAALGHLARAASR